MNKLMSTRLVALLLPVGLLAAGPGPNCQRASEARPRRLRTIRRTVAGDRFRRQSFRQTLDLRSRRISWQQQSHNPLRKSGRSQRCRAPDRQPSRPRIRSVDVDARHQPRPSHRPAGPQHALFRHRFQFRRSGGTGRRSVRLLVSREKPIDDEPCWKIESKPRGGQRSQYSSSILWIRESNYTYAVIENYKDTKLIRRLKVPKHGECSGNMDRAGTWRWKMYFARAGRDSNWIR